MKPIFTLLFLMFVTLKVDAGSYVKYIVGEVPLIVPMEELANVSPWLWFKSFSGIDENVDGFIFELNPKEVEGYNPKHINSKIIGSVSDFSRDSLSKYSDSSEFSELWYGKLDYADREIIRHEESKTYFVFASKGYRGMFYVFSDKPDENKWLPSDKRDFLVAICSGSSVNELKNVTCSRQFLIQNNLLVNYSFSLDNLVNQKKLDLFILNKIISWSTGKG